MDVTWETRVYEDRMAGRCCKGAHGEMISKPMQQATGELGNDGIRARFENKKAKDASL